MFEVFMFDELMFDEEGRQKRMNCEELLTCPVQAGKVNPVGRNLLVGTVETVVEVDNFAPDWILPLQSELCFHQRVVYRLGMGYQYIFHC